jgi:hypothetical protein
MTMIRMQIQAGLMILLFSSQAFAWVHAAPNEATFFDDPNFKGPSLALRLEPGMRHKLLPHLGGLDKKISSLMIGENVKVLVFTNPEYGGAVREYRQTIAEAMPDDDQISSLIVCLRDAAPQGVLFIQKRISEVKTPSRRAWHYITGKGKFCPLPESEGESEARFTQLDKDWNDQVRYVYVSPAVEAELFEDPGFGGKSLSLPSPDAGHQTFFDLSAFGLFDLKKTPPGVISSLIIRTRGSKKN